jgi:hypothetical protein
MSGGRMITSDQAQLESTWKDDAVVYFYVLSEHLPGENKRSHKESEKPQSG